MSEYASTAIWSTTNCCAAPRLVRHATALADADADADAQRPRANTARLTEAAAAATTTTTATTATTTAGGSIAGRARASRAAITAAWSGMVRPSSWLSSWMSAAPSRCASAARSERSRAAGTHRDAGTEEEAELAVASAANRVASPPSLGPSAASASGALNWRRVPARPRTWRPT